MLTRRLILLVAILLGVATSAIAGPRVAVVLDDSTTSRQLYQLLQGDLRQLGIVEAAPGMVVPTPKANAETAALPAVPGGAGDIIVAIGAPALRQIMYQAPSRQIIVVLITRSAFEEELARVPGKLPRDLHAIVLDQPVDRYLDLVRLALPHRQRIGLLVGPKGAASHKGLEKMAAERDMIVNVARVYEDAVFVPQLERLLTQSDVLLALPDASIHNRNNVQPLLLTTYRAGVPVVAYSEAYAQAGALVALYTTPAQLARQAAEVIQHLSQGRSAPPMQMPRYFSITVNGSVARSLGLTLPSAEALRVRLQQSAGE